MYARLYLSFSLYQERADWTIVENSFFWLILDTCTMNEFGAASFCSPVCQHPSCWSSQRKAAKGLCQGCSSSTKGPSFQDRSNAAADESGDDEGKCPCNNFHGGERNLWCLWQSFNLWIFHMCTQTQHSENSVAHGALFQVCQLRVLWISWMIMAMILMIATLLSTVVDLHMSATTLCLRWPELGSLRGFYKFHHCSLCNLNFMLRDSSECLVCGSAPKTRAPNATPASFLASTDKLGHLDGHKGSFVNRIPRVGKVEVQEVFDPADLNSDWQDTFKAKKFYVWMPGKMDAPEKMWGNFLFLSLSSVSGCCVNIYAVHFIFKAS